jgi:hypothetical protein
MPKPFDPLWERLLRGGVGRRQARRYHAELSDHLEDLIAEERRTAGAAEARSRALARLGSTDALAGAMISRREFRAWSARAPVAAYLIAPSAALAIGGALAMAGVVITCTALRSVGGAAADLPAWLKPAADGAVFFTGSILPVVLGWALSATAIRQRSSPLLPILGIVLLAAIGAGMHLGVTLPSPHGHGEINIMLSLGPTLSDWAQTARHLTLNLVLMLTPYAYATLSRADLADSGV